MREMKDSGIEYIGLIPKSWGIISLKRIASFHNGDRSSNYPSATEIRSEGIPFLTSENIHGFTITLDNNSKYISAEKYHSLRGAKLQQGDIAFCLRGSIGECAINENLNEGTVASSLVLIRPFSDVLPRFLNYCLNSYVSKGQSDYYMNGSCAANLSVEVIREYMLPFPSNEMQQHIVSYLDNKCSQIDAAIIRQESLIKKLEEYRRSVITEAVTKGLDPDAEMKDSGIEWIGGIPSGWDIDKLKRYFIIIGGNGFKLQYQGNSNGDYPFFKAGNISEATNDIPSQTSNYVTKDLVRSEGYNLIPAGSVLMPKIGEAMRKNSRALSSGTCCIDNNCQALIPMKMNTRFSLYLLKIIDMRWYENAGPVPSLNNKKLLNSWIPIPSKEEQQKIVSFLDSKCSQIDEAIRRQESIIEKLKAYRQSLIYEVVTGKREVL